MMPVVTIRPAPGNAATVALGRELGLAVVSHPLFAVEPVAWDVPDAAAFDAVLFGSANAVRHGGPGLANLTALPALCVGEATARAARAAGFTVVATGSGGLQSLLPVAERLGFTRLLRLSGEAHVPIEPPLGTTMATRLLYRVASRPINADFAAVLSTGSLILLHSGAAATHFSAEVDRLGIPRGMIALACLAPRIAERAGIGWKALSTATMPDDRALLALAAQMCQA